MKKVGAALAAAAVGFCLGSKDVSAQLLERGDPSYISLGAGAFDVLHDETAGEFRGEFRSNYRLLGLLKPFLGLMGTTDGAFYGYGGFGIDLYFGDRFVLTPNAAVGYFYPGDGKRLGSRTEFRTGAEFAYRFEDRSRLGIAFHHTSNAGISEKNPGAESLMLIYSIPLHLLK